MEMRHLRIKDYDELLEMLNSVFARKYGRAMDFLNEQPRMWVRDDEHMRKHIGIFDGDRLCSVVGVYPLRASICGIPMLFATTGNVATRPEYEGRGYFTALFNEAMAEAERMGVQAARLGGARQRYGRYGFEPCGTSYNFTVTHETRVKFFDNRETKIDFEEIAPTDAAVLLACREMRARREINVERGDVGDVYRSLTTKHCAPYAARIGGETVGYLSAYNDGQFVGRSENGRHIAEICAKDTNTLVAMICGWQERVGSAITLSLPPYMTEAVRLMCDCAQETTVVSPSMFRVLDFIRLTDALMKLKAKCGWLDNGECVIEIEGRGRMRLFAREENAGCERTDAVPDLTLTVSKATRLLYGHLPADAVANVPPILRLWLPLPLSWDGLDYV